MIVLSLFVALALVACAAPTAAPTAVPPTTAPAQPTAAPAQPTTAPAQPTAAPAQPTAAAATKPAATATPVPVIPPGRVVVEFWHGLGKPLGDILEGVAADFNKSQDKYYVNAIYKGSYPDTMNAAIAAYRAGKAPNIVQMFEVGTATMMAAKGAIKPVYELAKETGVTIDPKTYIPAVRGYYSEGGNMISMPLNSSTTIMYYNKDVFKKAGLDANKPPKTWAELRTMAKQIMDTKSAACAFSSAWLTWAQFENFSAIHNVPLATKANGMQGMDAELKFNSDLHVRHMQLFVDMQKEGTFKYGGRDSAAEPLFTSGECAIMHTSSGFRANVTLNAKFDWGVGMLPYYDDVAGAPKNSIIGGASLWVMNSPGRTADQYKAVAEFFKYISQPDVDAQWHQKTGYVPISLGGFDRTKASGFYDKNPGADIPYLQLTRTEPTENSMGLRLGDMPAIRIVIYEEMEKAFQGQQTAKQALDNAVKRGNELLRAFEKTYK
ncbi:MAG: sn-glycerol-3-phosphate ABC transporter substrate-binding protein UgpB [Chloroflexi bacterium]|nr:sn-glycerol-3-phosphate ABC transporter substrate-binding protein UgpB [Chloroflexota bacterium]